MSGLVELILRRTSYQCDLCGVAILVALIALGLGGAHFIGHP